MPTTSRHRKRVKHYNDAIDIHELTFSCYERQPLLSNDQWRSMLSKSIDRAIQRHRFGLAAYVFMPEHVHLLVWPMVGASGVDALLKAIKRPFAYRVKKLLQASNSRLLSKLTVCQRPGVTCFRFWQEGPGYDRNLTEVASALASIDYIHLNPVRRSLCTSSHEWRWSSASVYRAGKVQDWSPQITPLPAEWLGSSPT